MTSAGKTVISNQYSGVRYGGTSSERNSPPLNTRPSTLARFGFRIFVFAWRSVSLFFLALSLCVGTPAAAQGQASLPHKVRCPSPANPVNLHFECVGRGFDFVEETLTKDWAGLRTDLSELGIKPTASYTTNLMGNPGGGQSRGFTYSGTLQASIFWDLHKLLRIPGLSFNIGAAWSTGKNLSADHIGNIFTGAERLHGTG